MTSRPCAKVAALVAFLIMGLIEIELIETVARMFHEEVIESGLGWNAPADMLIAYVVSMLCFIIALIGTLWLATKVTLHHSKKTK